MSERVEIDDEMIVRAAVAAGTEVAEGGKITSAATMRLVLEAALNPPPKEPEIEVTEEQISAGHEEWLKRPIYGETFGQVFGRVYRAMRKLEEPPLKLACYKCGCSVPEGVSHRCGSFADLGSDSAEAASYGVGPVPGRTDGLLALHVGATYVYLSLGEARDLIATLRFHLPLDRAETAAQVPSPADRLSVYAHRRASDDAGDVAHRHARIYPDNGQAGGHRRNQGFGCFDEPRDHRRSTDERRTENRRKDDR